MTAPAQNGYGAQDSLTFAEWLGGVIVRWRIIAATLGVCVVLAILALIFIHPVYRTKVSFIPNSTSGAKLPSLGGGGLSSITSQLGMGSGDPSESPGFYTKLLESRELLTRIINTRFPDPRTPVKTDSVPLIDMLRIKKKDPIRKRELAVKKMSHSISPDYDRKTSMVEVNVDAEYPELSAQIANRALQMVNKFNMEQRSSRARSKRVYLEGRLNEAKAELVTAENRHRDFLMSNREWRSSPALTADEAQLQREVNTSLGLYNTLQQQYENTRLDEFNDAALITVVDTAVVPRKALWPRYGLLTIATLFVGLLIGTLIAAAATLMEDWRIRYPSQAERFDARRKRAWSEVKRSAVLSRGNGRRYPNDIT